MPFFRGLPYYSAGNDSGPEFLPRGKLNPFWIFHAWWAQRNWILAFFAFVTAALPSSPALSFWCEEFLMRGVVLPQKSERLPEIVRVVISIDFNPTSVSMGPDDPPLEFDVLLSGLARYKQILTLNLPKLKSSDQVNMFPRSSSHVVILDLVARSLKFKQI